MVKAGKPKVGTRASNICPDPWAELEMQSEDKIPRPYLLLKL